MPSFNDVEEAYRHANTLHYRYWLDNNFLTWQWWVLLCITVIPWMIWIRLADKRRLCELISYYSLIALFSTALDATGTNLQFWSYPQHLVWFLKPPLIPADLSAIPVLDMLIYQYFPKWKSFTVAIVISSLITSFIVEPLFVWAKIYQPHTWRYIYSFPIYILTAALVKLIIQQALRYQTKQRGQSDAY